MVSPRFHPSRCGSAIPLAMMAALLPMQLASQATQTLPLSGSASGTLVAGSQLTRDEQSRLDQLQAALSSAVTARDARAKAKLQNQIGELWFRAGNAGNSLDAYNHALAAAKQAQDAEQRVMALNGLGNLARESGQVQEALQIYQRALDVATTQGVTAGKADALNGLALLSAAQKQPAKALDYANQALEIRRSLGDHAGEALILAEIATGYNAAGDQTMHSNTRNRPTTHSMRRAMGVARPCRCSAWATSMPVSETRRRWIITRRH